MFLFCFLRKQNFSNCFVVGVLMLGKGADSASKYSQLIANRQNIEKVMMIIEEFCVRNIWSCLNLIYVVFIYSMSLMSKISQLWTSLFYFGECLYFLFYIGVVQFIWKILSDSQICKGAIVITAISNWDDDGCTFQYVQRNPFAVRLSRYYVQSWDNFLNLRILRYTPCIKFQEYLALVHGRFPDSTIEHR